MEVKFYVYSKFNLLIDKSHGFEGCLSCCVRKTDSIWDLDFGIDIPHCDSCFTKDYTYYNIGRKIFEENKSSINEILLEYTDVDGVLDISKIEKDWFPNVKADIFLSHSHKDEKIAIAFAGWLKKEFGLNTFIDSCIWKYSNELLKQIDDGYCQNDEKTFYIYEKRNISTSHVHMILANALMKMINKTESFIFFNTENSIVSASKEIEALESDKTYSPWIYLEINAVNLVKQTLPSRHIEKMAQENYEYLNESKTELLAKYEVNLKNLVKIDDSILSEWSKAYNKHNKKVHALNALYELTTSEAKKEVAIDIK